ncbi:MAG: hypothetical protein ACD_15C00189G0002 [uncultured bacterium]|nr:MAG: hypothetical protein ACD_15C00189G0002 [uncultured bacterium]
MTKKRAKVLHVLNWFHGNVCIKKCSPEIDREHYQKMRKLIEGHEDYPITYKLFIQTMREKHKIYDLPEKEFGKSTKDFWKHSASCPWNLI